MIMKPRKTELDGLVVRTPNGTYLWITYDSHLELCWYTGMQSASSSAGTVVEAGSFILDGTWVPICNIKDTFNKALQDVNKG